MSSTPGPQPNVTELLRLASGGNEQAREELFRTVYAQLRQMAHRAMQKERANHTLQPTALVHEAFVRLVDEDIPWGNREHFFAIASTTMRRVLIDYARSIGAQKRDCGQRVDLDHALLFSPEVAPELIALDEALTRMEARYPRACRVVELHYFSGMTAPETASILGISVKTVHRDWKLARAWLHAALSC